MEKSSWWKTDLFTGSIAAGAYGWCEKTPAFISERAAMW